MNKQKKIAFTGIALIIILALGTLIYFKFMTPRLYTYTAAKGQKYSMKYFPNAKILSGSDVAEKIDYSGFKNGGSMLTAYLKDDIGIMMSISDSLNKPFTKTCTGTDRFAFSVDDYEVCKQMSGSKTASLTAKVGNDSKYFVVTIGTLYDTKRITEEKDMAYIQEFKNFDMLQHEKELIEILKSIHPV